VARQTGGGSCLTLSIVLFIRLLGGELGMMPVRVCVRVLCSYSQTDATSVVPRNQLGGISRAGSRRRYVAMILEVLLPLLFFHCAQVFHAALLGHM